jgi:hypothetical protein
MMLQQPDTITILYGGQFRQVRMNQPHPARVIPLENVVGAARLDQVGGQAFAGTCATRACCAG